MRKKQDNREWIIVLLVLLFFGMSYRIVDYPPNFTPIAAISLFAGFYFRCWWAALVPILVLSLSDVFLGGYQWKIMISVYSSFALIVFLGRLISRDYYAAKIIFGSLAGSVVFFLITNFSVWCFGGWYANDLAGLMECFWMAIPFFRNTLLGNIFFTSVLFSAYELYVIYGGKTYPLSHKGYVQNNS